MAVTCYYNFTVPNPGDTAPLSPDISLTLCIIKTNVGESHPVQNIKQMQGAVCGGGWGEGGGLAREVRNRRMPRGLI